MRTMRAVRAAGLFALCLFLFAACAPEGDPMGVNALPTDPGTPIYSTVHDCSAAAAEGCTECATTRQLAAACEESCQTE
ncbi:hypothetical protein DRQ53_03840 [bacterium]|nr:MAG: hypothetical protein DRQ32_06205 [bacterium]RKZ17314.1 MAG: hypothetical protein DRQ53_03840 [bacterium]